MQPVNDFKAMKTNIEILKDLIQNFKKSHEYYKRESNRYNEYSCRLEYIDKLLLLFGWDISNAKGNPPEQREVIVEKKVDSGRPDYTLMLNTISKIFVEAKKPAVDISIDPDSALQIRKYGWNANHKIAILTNFEYLIIYDTSYEPKSSDNSQVARYRIYNYKNYIKDFKDIASFISRESVHSGSFDNKIIINSKKTKVPIDVHFLSKINTWRVLLSNDLYKREKYHSLEILNDVVQEFINQIVFLRICEDKQLPLYHNLNRTIKDPETLKTELEILFQQADKRYNAGLFSGEKIIFDLNNNIIIDIIESLYYPQTSYLFNIIDPNILGKIYEMFLTEHLILSNNEKIELQKKEGINRSIVTTPLEIVKYMVRETMTKLCEGKTPEEILTLKIADIACGSGIYLEEIFEYLQNHCVNWYLQNDKSCLIETENGGYKLFFDEKKKILCSCIYGIDIDIHAVEVAKFSLFIKLIQDETEPSISCARPILPNLDKNILHGNSLIGKDELKELDENHYQKVTPFYWDNISESTCFDAIIGNPPYVKTEDMHNLLAPIEFEAYKKYYASVNKQFDKYFLFIERALTKIKDNGYVCYIVPNKFFKIPSGKNLCKLIALQKSLISINDFECVQLFNNKTTYSCIMLLQKLKQDVFSYSTPMSINDLFLFKPTKCLSFKQSVLENFPWVLTSDSEFLPILNQLLKTTSKLGDHVNIFNGIQTSAETSPPVYWFSQSEIQKTTKSSFEIVKEEKRYKIEKAILRPYFKPTKRHERGLTSYSLPTTDKYIIFPYDSNGILIPINEMKLHFPGTYEYFESQYNRLLPKSMNGNRDVPNATDETWYQYGRTQALTSFTNTPKLIVGILRHENDPMYIFDSQDMVIASGGTAGYCAITQKENSSYSLEYIQAWLTNPYTEKIIKTFGSPFEGGFYSRGTAVLRNLPFVKLDFSIPEQKSIHDQVTKTTKKIYEINIKLTQNPTKHEKSVYEEQKKRLIREIESLISSVYQLSARRTS